MFEKLVSCDIPTTRASSELEGIGGQLKKHVECQAHISDF